MQNGKWMVMGGVMMLVGMAAGAHLFGAQPAEAQPTHFSQCFAGQQEVVDIDASGVVAAPRVANMIGVPSGYTVVGGGGGASGRFYILFCR